MSPILKMEEHDAIKEKHAEIALHLNLDEETTNKSWDMYENVRQNFTLEGNQLDWICCALRASCRQAHTPTVTSNTIVEGNCVSLTNILRRCDMSLYKFFEKMKVWNTMTSISSDNVKRFNAMERSFRVTAGVYRKFRTISELLFVSPSPDESKPAKGRKVRPTPCTPNKVMEFVWYLFILAKAETPEKGVDVVSSVHTLLCSFDLIFMNAIVDNRKDLIQYNDGVPAEWSRDSFNPAKCHNHSIMDKLCEKYDMLIVDAMHIKAYSWTRSIRRFFDENILKGDSKKFTGLISKENFETNIKKLKSTYTNYILSTGGVDEGLFLGTSIVEGVEKNTAVGDQSQIEESNRAFAPDTPVTRRDCLPDKKPLSPFATHVDSVKRLHEQLGNKSGPSEGFERLLARNRISLNQVTTQLNALFILFNEKCGQDAAERFSMAKALYFNLLEKIINSESKKKPNFDLKIMNNMHFHKTLLCCALEIVLHTYTTAFSFEFPWVLDCLKLDAYLFYRIIEMVVLYHGNILARDVIKHLNKIEEECIEKLVWQSNSSLWTEYPKKFPSWSNVESKKIDIDLSGIKPHDSNDPDVVSPSKSASLSEQFQQSNDAVKKQLFKTDVPPSSTSSSSSSSSPPTTSTAVLNAPSIKFKLFMRKVFKLATSRISEMLSRMGHAKDKDNILQKIWTIFEYSMMNHCEELMKDRHLDQIWMCAVYIFMRVYKTPNTGDTTFTEILRLYRFQPQGYSDVYRNMMLKDGVRGDIIQFYNQIYILQMRQFVMKFGASQEGRQTNEQLLLSPAPPLQMTTSYKIDQNVFVGLIDKRDNIPNSPSGLTYTFHESPQKCLLDINRYVRAANTKRNIEDMGNSNMPDKKFRLLNGQTSVMARKLQTMINDRNGNEDSG